MRVLMLGWEFPPFSSGGLGTACYGLTKALAGQNVDILFVVPNAPDDISVDFMKTIVASRYSGAKNIKIKKIDALLAPYMTSGEYDEALAKSQQKANYGRNIYGEAERYAEQVKVIAENEEFDIVHAHDWMTYKAGIAAKRVSGKPLIVHVHATEFDRTGGNCNQMIYDIEREGLHAADSIITVSNYTKAKITERYGIDYQKVNVVHNAVEFTNKDYSREVFNLKKHNKIVLFLGRITIQKGPDWFLYAAKRVLDKKKNVKFVIAGTGDMERRIIEEAANLGIAKDVIFAGFISEPDLDKIYQMADLYVMPSISEPFGITPLESMRNKTPVIISKQSGVSEVIKNCVKVDFWDSELMAEKMIEILENKKLYKKLMTLGYDEVSSLSWDKPASECIEIYKKLGVASG